MSKRLIVSLDLLICLSAVCLLFVSTLDRPWLLYDEKAIIDNSFFPSPASFSEIFETFKEFGLNSNFLSSNAIYSSNSVTRSSPTGLILMTFANFFFKKIPILYHLLSLTLHLINVLLVYFIIKILTDISGNNSVKLLPVLLTLIWAIHPVMLESVLLSTNFPRLFTYIFFFAFFLDFLKNKEQNKLIKRRIIIPLIFLIPMFSTECMIILPFVFFIVSFQQLFQTEGLKTSFKRSFEYTIPYFTGITIYLIYFLFLSHIKSNHPSGGNEFVVFLERVLWLSPQIFFHSLKLIFYPKLLSVDQSLFIHLGKTLFDPYAVFCFSFLFMWLLVPLYLFVFRRKFPDLFFLNWTFFFALLPFLHILMPSYALFAERYLYLPFAFLIFGLAKLLSRNLKLIQVSCLFLCILLIPCFMRSHYRTLDWKNNYSFIESIYKAGKDPLHKAVRLHMLANTILSDNPRKKEETRKYFFKTLELLNQAKQENKILQLKYQKNLPLIIKSYGLDYNSIPVKIAYLEAYTRCNNLYEPFTVGIKILKPYMKKPTKVDPVTLDLYTHLLLLDKQYIEAKKILLAANSIQPHLSVILLTLFEIAVRFENDRLHAEKYLLEAFKYYPYEIAVLERALVFYEEQKNLLLKTKFAYLLGLRTQLKPAYQEAMYGFLDLGQLKGAKKTLNKLLKIDPHDPETLYLLNRYQNQFVLK